MDIIKSMDSGREKHYFFISLVVLTVLVSWLEAIDRHTAEYIDGALVQATATFAIARAFNAIVSVLQEFTVSIFTFEIAIGQALDPINDLVEQFSSLMKLALGSLIIQKVILEIVSENFFKIILSISGLFLVLTIILNKFQYLQIAFKTFIFLAFVRFSVVMVVLLYSAVDTAFINEKVEKDQAYLENFPQDIEQFLENKEADEEFRSALEEDMKNLESMVEEKKIALEGIDAAIAPLEIKKIEISERISAIKSEMSATDRWNPLRKDSNVLEAEAEISAVEEQIKKINAERNLIVSQIETLAGDINKIKNTLEGKSNSVFESVGKSLTSVTSGLANFRDKLKEYVADMALAIPNIVNIMTLFVFRTVILPLVFLYAFMKAFKLIWGVNVRKAIESGYSDLKKEVAGE
jgi:uncharacterized protein YoxC